MNKNEYAMILCLEILMIMKIFMSLLCTHGLREYLSTYEVLQTYSYNMFICYYDNQTMDIQDTKRWLGMRGMNRQDIQEQRKGRSQWIRKNMQWYYV